MNAVENQVRELVKVELSAANERFPPFHSAHEGWAVILEEVDELKAEVKQVDEHFCFVWTAIKYDWPSAEYIKEVYGRAINAACEAIQVAAMCQKFLAMEEVVD